MLANLLASSIGHTPADRLLRITPGSSAHFIPYLSASSDALQLFELVLPADAPDGPAPEMYAADGWYHTDDLFERAGDSMSDGWTYRGRSGDWIRTAHGFVDAPLVIFHRGRHVSKCYDERSTEDALRSLCADLIDDAVVVGQGRPWPVFVVETQNGFHGTGEEESRLKQKIVDRMHGWGKDRYQWEKVDDTPRILVVRKGELLRTGEKGNVRYVLRLCRE